MNISVRGAHAYEPVTVPRQMRVVDNRLRYLDVDDIYLLSLLGDGKRLTDSAKALSLSQPAITQRIHKIEQALGVALLERSVRGTFLTERGLFICRSASDALQELEAFFAGMVRRSECVGTSGAWAAWIMAGVLTQIPKESGDIDVESVPLERILNGGVAVDSTGGNSVEMVFHRRTMQSTPGLRVLGSTTRQVTLWGPSDITNLRSLNPVPLLEISRDEALLGPADVQKIEAVSSSIRGVRYAGTVAGAVKMAARGSGILVAPLSDMELGIGLSQLMPEISLPSATFDLLIHQHTPVPPLATLLMTSLR